MNSMGGRGTEVSFLSNNIYKTRSGISVGPDDILG